MNRRIKDFFIAHKGNNFRPDFLERVSVGIMLVLVLLSFAMANIQALLWIGSDWLVSTILPAVIVDLTNEERDTESLIPLKRNTVLDRAAKMKADDMAKNEYFAHYSPDGVSPWYWFDEAGYDYLHAGENLAVHFTESSEVIEAWMNSPLHKANIMNGQYVEIGVGTAKGEYKGSSTIYVVQLFGTPRAKTAVESGDSEGNDTEVATTPITIEKVAILEAESDVAPATIVVEEADRTIESSEKEIEVETTQTMNDTEITQEPVTVSEQIVYTSLATTSREGEPAAPSSLEETHDTGVSIPARTATESGMWLRTLYAILAFSVLASLVTSFTFEWRRHHPIQIAYAGGLLVVMALLLYAHELLTGQVLIA